MNTTMTKTFTKNVQLNPHLEGYLKSSSEDVNMSHNEVMEFFAVNNVEVPSNFQPLMPIQLKNVDVACKSNTPQRQYLLSYKHSHLEDAMDILREKGIKSDLELLAPAYELLDLYTSSGKGVKGVTCTTYFTIPMMLGLVEGDITLLRIDASEQLH